VYYGVHVWGGLLFAFLFLLHTGFQLPHGALSSALWILSVWVVVTGAVGWFLQWLVPKVLTPSASFEINIHRVPELIDELRMQAEALVAKADPRIRGYYDQQIAPDLAGPRFAASSLLGNAPGSRRGTGALDILRRTLAPDANATLESLTALHATKREIDMQYTMQRVLRGWLVLHLPVAIALIGLVVLHVFFIAYF
jgi:hypothetical protein